MSRSRLPLLILLLGSFTVRIAWALHQHDDPATLSALPDQMEYLQIGRNFLHGNGMQMVDPRLNARLLAWRTPGYPVFIALCGAQPTIVRAVQALLGTLSVLLIYLIGRRWLSVGPSLAAAALVGVDPFLIYYTGLLLSETLFISLMLGGLWCWVACCKRTRDLREDPHPCPLPEYQERGKCRMQLARWIGGGLLFGLATLVRPSAVFLGPLLALLTAGEAQHASLGTNSAKRQPYFVKRSLAAAVAAFLCTAIACFPWALRNRLLLGQWIWSSTNDGITLYDGFHPGATGESDQRFLKDMIPRVAPMKEVERSEYFKNLAHQFVREHPLEAIELSIVKVARTWSPLPLSEQFGTRRLYVVVGLVYTVPLFLLAIVGVASPGLSRDAKWILLAPALYFTVVHAASVGSLRYRAPAEPPLGILASAGAMSACSNSKRPVDSNKG